MARHELEVLEMNNAFYDAWSRRDLDDMGRVWAERGPVVCLHPGWRPVFGRTAVLSSWQRIFEGSGPVDVRCTHASVHDLGNVSMVVCFELLDQSALAATNVFVREGNLYRLAHHQATPVPRPPRLDVDPEQIN